MANLFAGDAGGSPALFGATNLALPDLYAGDAGVSPALFGATNFEVLTDFDRNRLYAVDKVDESKR